MGRTVNSYRFGIDYPWVFKSKSTNATWSPSIVTKTGSVLDWSVNGGLTIAPTSGNDPTFNFSSNTGVAFIEVESSDGFSGLTDITFYQGNDIWLTDIDITKFTALTNFYYVVEAANFLEPLTINTNGLINLTNLNIGGYIKFIDLSTNVALTDIFGLELDLSSLDISSNILLDYIFMQFKNEALITSLDFSSNTIVDRIFLDDAELMTSINLGTITSPTLIKIKNCALISFDASNLSSIVDLNLFNNNLTIGEIDQIIIDLDTHGLSNGTLNYNTQKGGQVPSATSLTAYNNLITKGWTITGAVPSNVINTDPYFLTSGGTVWTEGSGWTVSGTGTATHASAGATSELREQNIAWVSGKTYDITVVVDSNTGSGGNNIYAVNGALVSGSHLTVGTHIFTTASSDGIAYDFIIYGRSGEEIVISEFKAVEN